MMMEWSIPLITYLHLCFLYSICEQELQEILLKTMEKPFHFMILPKDAFRYPTNRYFFQSDLQVILLYGNERSFVGM